MFLEYIKSLILGIVEGITEWLPISSTGHMILVNELMKTGDGFFGSQIYLYVIQLGAILAIATLYFKKLNPFSPSKTKEEKRATWDMWFKVIAACIPAAVIGLLFNDYMDAISTPAVVSATLIIYGIAFILIERRNKKASVTDMNQMTCKTALLIGLFQVLSIIPGTSRSGSTILGAILIGCSRELAAEFSFFLAIPVMFGASLLKVIKYFIKVGLFSFGQLFLLLLGTFVAFVVSLFAIKALLNYVKSHDFTIFGWYRIILGIFVIIFFYVI